MVLSDQIIKNIGLNIKKISSLTSKTFIIIDKDDFKYILKYVNEHQFEIYEYLKSFECNILTPKKIIKYKGGYYFLLPFVNESYFDPKNLPKLVDSMKDIHKKTSKVLEIKSENEYRMLKIRNILNKRFINIESIIRQIEVKEKKNDYDLILLSKYYIILHAKKVLADLDEKVSKAISDNMKVVYAININNPCLTHFKGSKIISYSDAYFGIIVSDIARFYIQNDHLKENLFSTIDGWLNEYEDIFYKRYFKFLVIYIHILNLNLRPSAFVSLTNYIEVTNKLKKLLFLFDKYN